MPCSVGVRRYYSLEIEYYMSTLSSSVMSILTENFLWMRTLGTTPQLEPEVRPALIHTSIRF